MLAERDVDLGEHAGQTVGDHPRGAVDGLLGGLEHRDECSLPMFFAGGQQLRRTQQAGDVHIVAAGVGHSRGRTGIGQPGVLRHRQSVHIGAQQDRLTVAVAQHADHTGTAHAGGDLEAELAQTVGDRGGGAVLLM